MEAPKTYSYTPFESWYGYLDLIERNNKITKEIIDKYGNECPPPGSLAWPGDLQLLEAYGVTCKDIFKKLIELINETGITLKDKIELARSSPDKTKSCHTFTCVIQDKFHVEASYEFNETKVKTVYCAYCKIILPRNTGYIITNLHTSEKIVIPAVMLHLLEEHDDLGDPPGPLCIDPTRICRVLELGNTNLNENDILYRVAKSGKKALSDLEDYNYDNYQRICTLMLNYTSGRG